MWSTKKVLINFPIKYIFNETLEKNIIVSRIKFIKLKKKSSDINQQ